MNFRTIETKVIILKYEFDFDMLWIISIILIPNMHVEFNECKKWLSPRYPDFEIYPAHVLSY